MGFSYVKLPEGIFPSFHGDFRRNFADGNAQLGGGERRHRSHRHFCGGTQLFQRGNAAGASQFSMVKSWENLEILEKTNLSRGNTLKFIMAPDLLGAMYKSVAF